MQLPYGIVCSTKCLDGVYAAWLYENDSMGELEFPPLIVEEKTSAAAIQEAPSVQAVVSEVDECPTKKIPGAFV